MNDTIIIRYGGRSRMVLKMEQFFPRTKTWFMQFERTILRYCPDREEVINQMLEYLNQVAIPGLPEAARKLDGQIKEAHLEVVKHPSRSYKRIDAEYVERQLKSRQRRWPKYCAEFEMNREILEGMKED